MNEIVLQEILGTDLKNPYLSLLQEKDTNRIQIYYGTHLLETVPDDPQHIGFRSAAGRLYNAGLNRRVLSNLFGFDRRTLQSWGNALLEKDHQEALRILSGRSNYKMSPEIIEFARMRFFAVYSENRYSYSKQIREEIEEVFHISLCSETLRPLFNRCKEEILSKGDSVADISEADPDEPRRQGSCECVKDRNGEKGSGSRQMSHTGDENNRKCTVSAVRNQWFIHHAGICIFSSYISEIGKLFGNFGWIVKQWLCMILLEAVNIEQSKYLDFHSLTRLLGQTTRRPLSQRNQLNCLADEQQCAKIFKLNAQLCNCDTCSDFYYDPHTKHYTGISKILKGWCSSIGHADKVLHSDFIHSSHGEPLFIMHCDNYYDLRERYQAVVGEFRKCAGIEASRCITLIVDRGIFSSHVFESILGDPALEIITWEKDFKSCGELWEANPAGSFCMKKYRNSSRDIRVYTFKYIDSPWDSNPKMRRLVVQATNPVGKMVELGVLTSDQERPATQIISLIFKRWLQENDFKYLDKHYGINQIISYDTIDYSELKPFLNDKEVASGMYKASHYDKMVLEKKLKTLVYRKHCHNEKMVHAQQKLQEIEMQLKENSYRNDQETISEIKKQRRSLKANLFRWARKSFDHEIKEYGLRLQEATLKLEKNKDKVSKLDMLIDEEFQRLDVRKKKFMDVLKMYARNMFYHVFENFRVAYDNYRDDHEYFRNLTHADGIYRESDEGIEIILYPYAHLEPKTKKIIKNILADLTQNSLVATDGSGRKVVLKLMEREEIKIAVV